MAPMDIELPPLVKEAQVVADLAGFTLSCEPDVGGLLAALAAAVPPGGRILELGTGAGVGLAWLEHGLRDRRDVEIVSVDIDPEIQGAASRIDWPIAVRFELGDGAEVVGGLGQFALIFADAPGGKIFKLRRTINALAPGGVLVVDDMDLTQHEDPDLRAGLAIARERLLSNEDLVCSELGYSSGVIIAVKRR